ncbi:MAG: hypothetical protein JWR85_3526 [Marmoricola sp.]|nr:hypothetical protein [Marmoricola sp.]
MIRPASGDGGLDVVVPVGQDQHDVYQVKKFATNLTNGHKRRLVAGGTSCTSVGCELPRGSRPLK